ncbi:16S rRNA (cytosine(1402)-N(4))-methyltransferase RsmH [Ectothiorhodospiraceae bacterium WFHF3C12]|nr:16S rRNA (cytosine(1402)-N(4))-methyltransferase RsmH [Ectothiorhodospiraceae bacterium WFHF3C12]
MNAAEHSPVLLEPAVEMLAVRADGRYVDGTYGRGGHARRILQRLGPSGQLLVIDRDPEAIAHAQAYVADDARCVVRHAAFDELPALLRDLGWSEGVDGVLLDLGVSSPQLEAAERGFSFRREGPLDMRMDTRAGPTAAEYLAQVPERELAQVIRRYGEERFARRIARAIAAAREEAALPQTTSGLARLIAAAVPTREAGKDPATRTFQALRIAINRELEILASFLDVACDVLRPAGRLVVISFHSLEDRQVKRFMRDNARVGDLPPGVPVVPEHMRPRLQLVSKAIRPERHELEANPRARSAVMRVAERLP